MVTVKISVSIKNDLKNQYRYRDMVGYGMALGKLIGTRNKMGTEKLVWGLT
jgi:hypothetical protein